MDVQPFRSRAEKTRLEETLLEARNRYVMLWCLTAKPADYNEVITKFDQRLREIHDTPVQGENHGS